MRLFDAKPEQRGAVRKRLSEHMEEKGWKSVSVANAINAAKPKPDIQSTPPKPLISHDTIDRFLNEPNDPKRRIGRKKLSIIYSYLIESGLAAEPADSIKTSADSVFGALCTFYRVSDERVTDSEKQLEGTFQFFARSENRKNFQRSYIVRGAIKFLRDPKSGALLVEEKQTSKDNQDGEFWSGYYFIRKETILIVLHSPQGIPKFYILSRVAVEAESGKKINEMQGRMVKVGVNRGVFTSRVSFFRKDDAFDDTDVVQEKEVPRFIRDAMSPRSQDW